MQRRHLSNEHMTEAKQNMLFQAASVTRQLQKGMLPVVLVLSYWGVICNKMFSFLANTMESVHVVAEIVR